MTTIMPTAPLHAVRGKGELAASEARSISAWFRDPQVIDGVSLYVPAGWRTALIGPAGCDKSAFLQIVNRRHELIPSPTLAGEVLPSGSDICDPRWTLTAARRAIGMVFPNPNGGAPIVDAPQAAVLPAALALRAPPVTPTPRLRHPVESPSGPSPSPPLA